MKEKILELLEDMHESDLLSVHREYLDAVNGYDDYIYGMDEFDEIMDGQTPEWIACRVYYGDFNPNSDYFKFNGYGNLQSIYSYELLEYIYIDDIADYIIKNNDSLYNDEIQDILDEIEDASNE